MAMELVEVLASLSTDAENRLGTLALDQLDKHERKKALRQIQDRFDQMAADGVIDPEELGELKQLLLSQGLDGHALQRLFDQLNDMDASVPADGKFEEAFDDLINDRMRDLDDDQSELQFQIQVASTEASHYLNAASTLSKEEHKAYMHVIGNLKA